MRTVRLYGPVTHNGSFPVVLRGMREGLGERCVGLVPTDQHAHSPDELEELRELDPLYYAGEDADVGVLVGDPQWVVRMRHHAERWMLLPPNSTYVPRKLLRDLAKTITGLISPSQWGAGVLTQALREEGLDNRVQVMVWEHGISPSIFRPEPAEDYPPCSTWNVLHMASTIAERKGTRELLLGWSRFVDHLPTAAEAKLTCVIEGNPQKFQGLIPNMDTVQFVSRLDLRAESTASLYRKFHALCQPARGEGFGLTPLEARATGVPTILTGCTGHTQHAASATWDQGVYVIKTDATALEPIDDGPGALAPVVDPVHVMNGLMTVWARWLEFKASALTNVPRVHQRWSWAHVCRDVFA